MISAGQRLVLFDFDGVFVDTFDICLQINKKRAPKVTPAAYRRLFEGNIHEADFSAAGFPHIKAEEFDAEYVPGLMAQPLVEGMHAVTVELAHRYQLVVVSSTITSPIKEYLAKHHLAHLFTDIVGYDIHKSKIEKIKNALAKYDVKPTRAVFITDSLGDLREAHKVGVSGIAVTWGFHDVETLSKGSPTAIVHEPRLLIKVIDDFFDEKDN